MNGWIKLHRKSLDNEIFKHDVTAWRVFIYLLLIVDHRTGSWDTGRFVIANALGIKPCTIYKSLKRLENAKMITLASNNKYTTISICNWDKYQGDDNNKSNNKVTTKSQQSNTKQEVKNKEYNSAEKKVITIFPEIEQILEHYKEIYGIKTLSKQTEQVRAARDLLQDYGLDKVIKAIDIAHEASSQEYAPMIGNLVKLKEKYSDLQLWYRRNHKDQKQKMDDEVGEIKNTLGKVIKKGK